MSEEEAGPKSKSGLIIGIVVGLLALTGCGCFVALTAITVLGNNLQTAFEEVSTEVGNQQYP